MEKIANKIKRQIKTLKMDYYSQFKNKDSKRWWNEVKRANGKQQAISTGDITAEQLNLVFHNIWKTTTQSDISQFIKPPNKQQNQQQTPITLTAEQINNELMKLNQNALGPDSLNNSLPEGASHSINDKIAHLFNISFIPTQWKQANIVSIPKTKCPTTTNDFRPVALTSSLCKVLERIITKEILNITKDVLPTNKQFGFHP